MENIFACLHMLGSIGFIIAGYLIFYRIFTNKITNWAKPITIWILTSVAFFAVIFTSEYFMTRPPESFRAGVRLLEDDTAVLGPIGGLRSESYNLNKLPKNTDNPAKFQVAINGPYASIYLTCIMEKDQQGNWKIKDYQRDSLVRNK